MNPGDVVCDAAIVLRARDLDETAVVMLTSGPRRNVRASSSRMLCDMLTAMGWPCDYENARLHARQIVELGLLAPDEFSW